MPTNGQAVKIAHYTRAKFNSLTNKDSSTIYFVEETDGKLKQYIGNTQVVSDFTESDPTVPSHVKSITTGNISSWNNKVDKVSGKGLSTNDYTTAEKNKLSGIEVGAQKNSDITKAEIEAKLTGNITSHTHDKLDVIDTRTIGSGSSTFNLTPQEIEDKTLKPYFTQVSGAGSSWRSLINVKGWTGNYVAWQLIGPGGTSADDDLYFRSGVGSSWRTPRKIFHSGNLTAGDIPNLPASKITSGTLSKSRLPSDITYDLETSLKSLPYI